MAILPLYDFFVFNGQLTPASKFIPSENEGGIYEVLRIINGLPLFFEDHVKRFHQSSEISGKKLPFTFEEIKNCISELVYKNEITEGNVLVSFKNNLKIFFIPHKYPNEIQYHKGVTCGLLYAERINPNAKVFQTEVRRQANNLIARNNYYEVLLVNHQSIITEGSRSNVFFIKGEQFFTPATEKVLPGITRKNAILCATKLGFPVIEEEIRADKIAGFDAVFVTGTSPKILPVRGIGDHKFETGNKALRKLMEEFNQLISTYIKNAQQ